jgi:hypothetical protein
VDFGLLLIIVFILAPLLERLLAAGRKGTDELPPGQEPPGQRMPQQRMPPGQRMPQQRLPQQRPPEEEQTPFRSVPASHGEDDSAASVLPDDLWEILTGEKRPPSRPQPPTPPPEREPASMRTETAERPPIDREPPRPIDRDVPRPIDRPAPPPLDRRPDRPQRRERTPIPRDRAPRSRERPVEVRDRTPRERDPERLRPDRPPSSADKYVRPEHVRTERPVHVRAERVLTSYDDNIPGDEERHDRFHERLDRSAALAAAAAAGRAAASGPELYRFNDAADLRRAIVMAEILGPPKALE